MEGGINMKLKSKGFTLIEVLMSLVVTISVLGMLFHFVQQQRPLFWALSDTSAMEWEAFCHQMELYMWREKLLTVAPHRIDTRDSKGYRHNYVLYKDQIVRHKNHRGYQPLIFNLRTIEFKETEEGVEMRGIFKNGKEHAFILRWSRSQG